MSIVLQDELFEVQECPLVVDFLSDLNTRFPCVLRGESSTLGTLGTLNDEREDKSLLQDGTGKNLFLNDDLELDSTRVRLGPEEGCIDQSNF